MDTLLRFSPGVNKCRIKLTPPAGLDEDYFGLIAQSFAILCVEMVIDVVDVENIWIFLTLVMDSKNAVSLAVRHEYHEGAV